MAALSTARLVVASLIASFFGMAAANVQHQVPTPSFTEIPFPPARRPSPSLSSSPTTTTTSSGCTTTLTLTQSRLPTPPYWPQCEWDGTLSIYTSTVTVSRAIDCDGCTDVRVTLVPQVFCPYEGISTTVVKPTPKTVYKTVCSASASASAT